MTASNCLASKTCKARRPLTRRDDGRALKNKEDEAAATGPDRDELPIGTVDEARPFD